jgi:hypothetical protein
VEVVELDLFQEATLLEALELLAVEMEEIVLVTAATRLLHTLVLAVEVGLWTPLAALQVVTAVPASSLLGTVHKVK